MGRPGERRRARRGWAGSIHVEFAFSIFSAWAKAPAQQPAIQALSMLGLEWYCQASRLRRKVAQIFFLNSHTLSGNLHSIFRNLGSAGLALFLSSLPRYARPTERDIFQEIISAM